MPRGAEQMLLLIAALASTIASNSETVTRAIADLQDGGGIEVRERRTYVSDPGAPRRSARE